jgi:hypothetical protein
MGKGLTVEQIEGFVGTAQEILVQGFDDSAVVDTERHHERMRDLFRAPSLVLAYV